jgi:hypothetical protein
MESSAGCFFQVVFGINNFEIKLYQPARHLAQRSACRFSPIGRKSGREVKKRGKPRK